MTPKQQIINRANAERKAGRIGNYLKLLILASEADTIRDEAG